jgi:hypothetical protein
MRCRSRGPRLLRVGLVTQIPSDRSTQKDGVSSSVSERVTTKVRQEFAAKEKAEKSAQPAVKNATRAA